MARAAVWLAALLLTACTAAPEPAPADGARTPDRQEEARAHYLRGLEALGATPRRVDEASRAFEEALAADPGLARAHYELGICRFHQGRFADEIAAYERALALEPRLVPALLNLGHALLAADRLEEAAATYERLLEVEPGHGVGRHNLDLIRQDLEQRQAPRDGVDPPAPRPRHGPDLRRG